MSPFSMVGAAATVALAVAALSPTLATAQGSCGPTHDIRPGDTLSAIATRCGLPLDAVLAANPGIEPRRLRVGQTIALPHDDPPQAAATNAVPEPDPVPESSAERAPEERQDTAESPPADDRVHVVRAGDSLPSIARQHGIPLSSLIAENPQLHGQHDLETGQALALPPTVPPTRPSTPTPTAAARAPTWQPAPPPSSQPRPFSVDAAVEVSPRRVAPGDTVTLYARGFPPRTTVDIAAGTEAGGFRLFGRDTTDNQGTLRTRLSIPIDIAPAEGDAGPALIVVATADGSVSARSPGVRLRAASDLEPGHRVEIVGRMTAEGVECPALRDDEGRLFTLAGPPASELQPGTPVRIIGLVAGASFCQQGITLSAARIERLDR